ncbi:MipA/OmpV family protein [Halomonas daqingensis]|uniref:MipA/OmpV family protein n=1 Tax=Billgrantia desiderata TaxID=52021 RepID=A0ABS9B9U8_9GAMM|nr:MipA/OmpV family protein [Halomonas desiderata]MCE8014204.1 MipA/OmpV family protein [Halomonas desiderata]MCE8030063.1 MipA/OmpV family protein [Halomonas desiderata]MCE8044435.1 MipA/OmpV family protein [Halomonas desiderata]MCE8049009.1 MipA/OmpV family protein [Halomonas desiderata]
MPSSYPLVSIAHGSAVRVTAVALLAMGLGGPVTAMAQAPGDAESSTTWALGLGVLSAQEPYAGIGRDNTALPLLQFENQYVHLFGPRIEFKLPSLDIGHSQQLNFGIVGQYDGSGYEEGDAPILNAMEKRRSGFWAGGVVEWSTSFIDVSAEWLADVSGNSNGQIASLGLERTWRFGNHVLFTPHVGASWQDEKTVDYYFGVRENEARLDRPAYVGEAGVNIEAGVRGVYMFDRHHSVLVGGGVTSLADEIKDSPLVDRSTVNSVYLGYMYRF